MWEFWLISSTIGANAIERTIMGACGYLGSSTVIEISFETGPPSEWFGVVSLPGRVELQACSSTSSFEGMGRTGWEASNCGSKMLNTACIHQMTDHHLLMGSTTTHHHEWLDVHYLTVQPQLLFYSLEGLRVSFHWVAAIMASHNVWWSQHQVMESCWHKALFLAARTVTFNWRGASAVKNV